MNAWTAGRLDALPDDTVVEFTDIDSGNPRRTTRYPDGFDLTYWRESFSGVDVIDAAVPGSIRVVSVPIDALLASTDPFGSGVIRAAIAHVTGEQS